MREATKKAYRDWFRVTGTLFGAFALVVFFNSFFARKFHLQTGPATWIWVDGDTSVKMPIAFFAVRDILIPPDPPLVRVRIACDADWTLYLDGNEMGGGGATPLPELRVFDLKGHVRKGVVNRLVVALRSADGTGGLLASVDFAPLRENDVVTDATWRICRDWSSDLLTGARSCEEAPRVLGVPPVGRWNYPAPEPAETYVGDAAVLRSLITPRAITIRRNEIRVINGVAVESSQPVKALLFDFGGVEGRGRVTLPAPTGTTTPIEVRYGAGLDEIERQEEGELLVFAKGENVVTDPVARSFRYMAVGVTDARVEVVEQAVSDDRR